MWILILIIILFNYNLRNNGGFYYSRRNGTKLTSILYLKNILPQENIKQSLDKSNCDIILPDVLKNCQQKLFNDLKKYKNKIFFVMPNHHVLGNKYNLWDVIVKSYGVSKAMTLMPFTYRLPEEYDAYKRNYKKELVVFKTNEHKQEGLYITKSLISRNMIDKEKFIVAQKYLTDSLLYKGHKVNLRMYLFLICSDRGLNAYIFDDGIISYTKEKYDINTNSNSSFASFYDSDDLYKKGYPITLKEFLPHIPGRRKLIKFAHDKIRTVVLGSYRAMINNVNFNGNVCCDVYGVDIFVDTNMNCSVIEINIGPGMEPYGKKDKNMRDNLYKNILMVLKGNKSNFVKIL